MREYKRLTERTKHGIAVLESTGRFVLSSGGYATIKALKRLAELEDKIENGTLIEQKQGEWLLEITPDGTPYCFHCSVCDKDFRQIENKTKTNYCPDCGAKLEELQEKDNDR